jgi:D-beta-D-heptose 7-phosphate kinase/D-beta-D-heptose 1-phosphate adenosyltransferase
MNSRQKIVANYSDIAKLVKQYRQNQQSIVLTQGSFDMVHIGHGRYLEKAKKHGDVLIVGVDDDAKIRMRKGEGRPIVPEKERLEMLSFFASVDHVVLKPVKAPKWQLIKLIKPDVLIATADTYTQPQIKQLKQICGRVVVLPYQATTSTSAKLRRLQLDFVNRFSDLLSHKIDKSVKEVLREMGR